MKNQKDLEKTKHPEKQAAQKKQAKPKKSRKKKVKSREDYGNEPWEKQENETSKAYAAFSVYRDMGPTRSFRKAAIKYYGETEGKRRARVVMFERWSHNHTWVSRCESYDIEQELINRQEKSDAIEEMAKRHAAEALVLQDHALNRLRDMNPEELNPSLALRFLTEAIGIERSTRGAPSQKIEHSGKIITKEHGFERIIAEDPETRELIDELLIRLTPNEPSGVCISSKQRKVDTSKTS